MLKHYIYHGKEWLFEEREAPEGAVELKAAEPPKNKAVRPANKAAPARKKAVAAK